MPNKRRSDQWDDQSPFCKKAPRGLNVDVFQNGYVPNAQNEQASSDQSWQDSSAPNDSTFGVQDYYVLDCQNWQDSSAQIYLTFGAQNGHTLNAQNWQDSSDQSGQASSVQDYYVLDCQNYQASSAQNGQISSAQNGYVPNAQNDLTLNAQNEEVLNFQNNQAPSDQDEEVQDSQDEQPQGSRKRKNAPRQAKLFPKFPKPFESKKEFEDWWETQNKVWKPSKKRGEYVSKSTGSRTNYFVCENANCQHHVNVFYNLLKTEPKSQHKFNAKVLKKLQETPVVLAKKTFEGDFHECKLVTEDRKQKSEKRDKTKKLKEFDSEICELFLRGLKAKEIYGELQNKYPENIIPEEKQIQGKINRIMYQKSAEDPSLTLQQVAHDGNHELLWDLLEHDCSKVNSLLKCTFPNSTTKFNVTALHLAARAGHIKCVHALLEKGARADIKDQDGATALHNAIITNHKDIVELFLNTQGSSVVNEPDNDYWSPIHYSAMLGHVNIMKLLINHNADVDSLARYSDDKSYLERKISALILTVRYGHRECTDVLLDANARLDFRDRNGETALHWAIRNCDIDVVYKLIAKDPDTMKVCNNNQWSPLHFAVHQDHPDLIPVLIKNGADVNALARYSSEESSEKESVSPLHMAANLGHWYCAKLLLAHEADPSLQDNKGDLALHWSLRNGHEEISRLFVDAHPKLLTYKNKNRWFPFHEAVRHGYSDTCSLLPKDPNIINNLVKYTDEKSTIATSVSALIMAARRGDFEDVQTLLLLGATTDFQDTDGYSALHWAVKNNHINIATLLIKHDPSLLTKNDKHHWYPLHVAAGHATPEMIDVLLGENGDPNLLARYTDDNQAADRKLTPLILAATSGRLDNVQKLLDRGADATRRDIHRNTALHWAARNGHDEIVTTLLKKKSNLLEVANEDYWTALHAAVHTGYVDVVTVLLDGGADINASATSPDEDPQIKLTPIMLAVKHDQTACVKLLIQRRANLQLKDATGGTVLHLAVQKLNLNIINSLLNADPELVNIPNNSSCFPIHLATSLKHSQIVTLLFEKKADVNALATAKTLLPIPNQLRRL